MSDASLIVKPTQTLAALKNVAGFMQLALKIRRRAHSLPNFGVMYGPSGFGKSYASIYVLNKLMAVRVEVGESWNKKSFVRAILREAGIAEPKGSTADLMDQAIIALSETPDRPLIIDEADKLVDKGLIELVREIGEHSQIPVLLIGEEALPSKLARVERVHNRVLAWYPAEACDLADCRKLAEIFLAGIAIDDALLDVVREKAQGRARRVVVTMAEMREWYASNRPDGGLTLATYRGEIFTGEAPSARNGRITALRGGRAA
jgi:DNA transposition AAA+ family ATPase